MLVVASIIAGLRSIFSWWHPAAECTATVLHRQRCCGFNCICSWTYLLVRWYDTCDNLLRVNEFVKQIDYHGHPWIRSIFPDRMLLRALSWSWLQYMRVGIGPSSVQSAAHSLIPTSKTVQHVCNNRVTCQKHFRSSQSSQMYKTLQSHVCWGHVSGTCVRCEHIGFSTSICWRELDGSHLNRRVLLHCAHVISRQLDLWPLIHSACLRRQAPHSCRLFRYSLMDSTLYVARCMNIEARILRHSLWFNSIQSLNELGWLPSHGIGVMSKCTRMAVVEWLWTQACTRYCF